MSVRRSLKVLRGKKATIPTLDIGELGLTTDTNELYIGSTAGNRRIPIEGQGALFNSYTVAIPTTGWTESTDGYTQTFTVTGITAPGDNGLLLMTPVYTSSNRQAVMSEYGKILDADASTNALTITVAKPIKTAFSVTVKEVKK